MWKIMVAIRSRYDPHFRVSDQTQKRNQNMVHLITFNSSEIVINHWESFL